ncbi:MAG: NAD(P)/FAD-dependent oxidoreductase [Patescibacteria group bacterium]
MVEKKPSRPRIIVIGSGFAGISAYRTLRKKANGKVKLTLVSDSLFFAHIPLIHEVAAGTIQPELVYWPITEYITLPEKHFLHGQVELIDADAKTIRVLHMDGTETELAYDSVILAMGSQPYTFGTPGAETYALPFRTLHDAEHIRNRILDMCAQAQATSDVELRKKLLTFVLVGGGATGIELAGELVEMFTKELACSYPELTQYFRVTMVERADALLKERESWFGAKAQVMLKEDNVEILFGRTITRVTEEGLETKEGPVKAKTVFWTAGVRATDVMLLSEVPILRDERTGRIAVTQYLHTDAHPDMYVAGDQALALQAGGKPYGMRAQFAVREGRRAALNALAFLNRKLQKPFSWREKGMILTVGKGRAIAEIHGIHFTGLAAWIICHAVYILAIVGWKTRLKSAWYWTKHFLKDRNVCRLAQLKQQDKKVIKSI